MRNKLPYDITKRARKQLKQIKKSDSILYRKMLEGIESIRLNPSLGGAKKGDLKGFRSLDIYHQRTNYELTYKVEINEEGELVNIIFVGTRENFYDELKRYFNL
ncbi:type II toxin-antitoxin system RelE/ParE family toxin [Caldifermentibacillus hisashii]|uniref:type II toxin-antitoxin system RelE/ParE family toxin n=1 Tax=Caldifermentibacillus hisashii TaxID=996558 RepID=UPI003100C32A